ncbi:type 2 periplasmic-binding domain-containing protein [Roseateles koreensis]|nr:hypothetical protein [Roseateles koreensis]
MHLTLSCWLALQFCLPLTAAQAEAATEPLLVKHSFSQQQNATVISYELAVLTLLLDKTVATHGPYRLQASPVVTQKRAFLELASGSVSILSSMTSREREAQSIPVRACLYRGLLGVRLPVVLKSRHAELDELSHLDDEAELRKRLSVGQVSDWPDAHILSSNGWHVERLPRLSTFPEMLKRQRIDVFPLGAVEVYPIVDALPDLTVLDTWLIAYPSAYYFFVSPQQPALAQRLRAAWDMVLADGSFDAMFEQWVGPQLRHSQLSQRRWLILKNPDLPEATPLRDGRLWHPLVRQRLLSHTP